METITISAKSNSLETGELPREKHFKNHIFIHPSNQTLSLYFRIILTKKRNPKRQKKQLGKQSIVAIKVYFFPPFSKKPNKKKKVYNAKSLQYNEK